MNAGADEPPTTTYAHECTELDAGQLVVLEWVGRAQTLCDSQAGDDRQLVRVEQRVSTAEPRVLLVVGLNKHH